MTTKSSKSRVRRDSKYAPGNLPKDVGTAETPLPAGEVERAAERAGMTPDRRAQARLHHLIGENVVRASDACSELLASLTNDRASVDPTAQILEIHTALWRMRWELFINDVQASKPSEHVLELVFDPPGGAS